MDSQGELLLILSIVCIIIVSYGSRFRILWEVDLIQVIKDLIHWTSYVTFVKRYVSIVILNVCGMLNVTFKNQLDSDLFTFKIVLIKLIK